MSTTLDFAPELTDADWSTLVVGADAPGLQSVLRKLRESPPHQDVQLNLRDVREISSAELGLLIAVRLHLQGANRRLRLTEVQPHVYEILTLAKLDRTLSIDLGGSPLPK